MDLGEQLKVSFNSVVNDLVSAIPAIVGALIILAVGWIIAGIIGRVVTALLARAGADRFLATHGADVYGSTAQSLTVSRVAGTVVKWLVFFIFLIAAANFLGWPQVSDLLNRVILFIPNLVVAALILILAPVAGRILRRVIEGGSATAGLTTGRLLGRVAEIAVIAFGVVIAVNQVGIASDLVNILFTGVVVALAIAFGLAFGLGGRSVAEQALQSWYEKSREAADKVAAASAAAERAPAPAQARPAAPPMAQAPMQGGAQPMGGSAMTGTNPTMGPMGAGNPTMGGSAMAGGNPGASRPAGMAGNNPGRPMPPAMPGTNSVPLPPAGGMSATSANYGDPSVGASGGLNRAPEVPPQR